MNQVIASTRNRERARRMEEIAEALSRLAEDPDEFGLCEDCEEAIPTRRLELMPWTTLCIACQSKREDGSRGGSRKTLRDFR
jgi:DnaK suppressor protein